MHLTDEQAKQIEEALAPFADLFAKTVRTARSFDGNISCQVAVTDLRRIDAALSILRTARQAPEPQAETINVHDVMAAQFNRLLSENAKPGTYDGVTTHPEFGRKAESGPSDDALRFVGAAGPLGDPAVLFSGPSDSEMLDWMEQHRGAWHCQVLIFFEKGRTTSELGVSLRAAIRDAMNGGEHV